MNDNGLHGGFRTFFLDYFNAVVRFAMSYLQDTTECQDIAQETFIRLYEAWDTIGTEEQRRSFMYTTARNLCISRIRHLTVEEQFRQEELEREKQPDGDEAFFLSEVTYQETLRLLRRAIDELPQQSRRIILLGLEGKNNGEIADMLGVSVNTVKTLKKGAYRSLRTSLGGLSEELFIKLLILLGTSIVR